MEISKGSPDERSDIRVSALRLDRELERSSVARMERVERNSAVNSAAIDEGRNTLRYCALQFLHGMKGAQGIGHGKRHARPR